ncbi:hypothetical protein KTJ34_01710 [Acinetobacter courvalinii]|uniref:phage neck terminator protein n=1 Tax=Acinetobacter courvalinii TaxID=280147 RepID=UPI0021D28D72|nr:hypothetical protein [Acinetobacter courvalinii]MCU4576128.1 hypothetical protein [Acinetobacter courvalinii]
MSTNQPDINEQDLYTAIRRFILSVIPETNDVLQGIQNQVAMPDKQFIAMTTLFSDRISTNRFDYDVGKKDIVQPQKWTVQIDCYGEPSNVWATLLTTLLRDEYSCSQFPENIQPLYADDPKHLPIVNSEQQYEKRWMITACFQVNPKMSMNL